MTMPTYKFTRGYKLCNPLFIPRKIATAEKLRGVNQRDADYKSFTWCYLDATRILAECLKLNKGRAKATLMLFLRKLDIGEELDFCLNDLLHYCSLRPDAKIYLSDRELIVALFVRLSMLRNTWCPSQSYVAAGYDLCISDDDFLRRYQYH